MVASDIDDSSALLFVDSRLLMGVPTPPLKICRGFGTPDQYSRGLVAQAILFMLTCARTDDS